MRSEHGKARVEGLGAEAREVRPGQGHRNGDEDHHRHQDKWRRPWLIDADQDARDAERNKGIADQGE